MSKQEVNDKMILGLKKQIEDKKKALKASERFSPTTNCSIELDGSRYNINVLGKEQIVSLLVKLNSYLLSAKDLGLHNEFTISGFSLADWMGDLNSRLMIVNRRAEEDKLRGLENKLHNLLSVDTKIELEINDIVSQLK